MTVKRFRPDDPAIARRDVVLASDYTSLESALDLSETFCDQWKTTSARHEAQSNALSIEIAALRARSTIFDSDASLSDRLKAAGMLTASQVLAGCPMDAFLKHAGVHDLSTFAHWVEMRRREYLKLHARFTLAKREDDELFDWITAHMSVFGEVMINFKAAITGSPQACPLQTPQPNAYSASGGEQQEVRALSSTQPGAAL
jgi:hypothetical protein